MRRLSLFHNISHLVFPELCLNCSNELSRNENHICSICYNELTLTHFELYKDPSPMDKLFWGRVDVDHCYAHFFFEKEKAIQHILFGLKYKNNKEIGVHFGQDVGTIIKGTPAFKNIEALIPVPLHPKKKFIRGYNQSEYIARGISKNHGAKVETSIIKRTKHSASQTKKNRFQRWENVDGIFSVNQRVKEYKHLAIVDDMITTGSTIESMIEALRHKNPDLSISVITLAIAI